MINRDRLTAPSTTKSALAAMATAVRGSMSSPPTRKLSSSQTCIITQHTIRRTRWTPASSKTISTRSTRTSGVRCASMGKSKRSWCAIIITTVSSPRRQIFFFSQGVKCWQLLWIDLIGNVYARFKYEDSAQQACDELNSRWYAARPIYCELSPVTDFREACCRLNSGEGCVRGGFCNFIHRKEPSPELEREIELSTKKWLRTKGKDERSVSRSPSPEPTRRRY